MRVVRGAAFLLVAAAACSGSSGSSPDGGGGAGAVGGRGGSGGGRGGSGGSGGSAPMCQALFQGCARASDCCTGLNCLNATFCYQGNGLDNGSSCGFDEDCCSNHCEGGPVNGSCCSAANQPCQFNFECCDGFTCTGLDGRCCGAPQAQCTSTAECCASVGMTCGTICPIGQGCMTGYCCVQPGYGCFADLDCCGGDRPAQCFNGICCVSFGYPCTRDDECCGVSCTNGTCGG